MEGFDKMKVLKKIEKNSECNTGPNGKFEVRLRYNKETGYLKYWNRCTGFDDENGTT